MNMLWERDNGSQYQGPVRPTRHTSTEKDFLFSPGHSCIATHLLLARPTTAANLPLPTLSAIICPWPLFSAQRLTADRYASERSRSSWFSPHSGRRS